MVQQFLMFRRIPCSDGTYCYQKKEGDIYYMYDIKEIDDEILRLILTPREKTNPYCKIIGYSKTETGMFLDIQVNIVCTMDQYSSKDIPSNVKITKFYLDLLEEE